MVCIGSVASRTVLVALDSGGGFGCWVVGAGWWVMLQTMRIQDRATCHRLCNTHIIEVYFFSLIVSLRLSICLSVCMHVSISASVTISVSVSICLSIRLSEKFPLPFHHMRKSTPQETLKKYNLHRMLYYEYRVMFLYQLNSYNNIMDLENWVVF